MIQIKHRYTNKIIFEADVDTIKEAVELAVSHKIDLYNADLSHANLFGADLSNTNLTGAHLTRANLFDAIRNVPVP
jgi:uncharacterized protein YjbI with pentapeptide repeats